MSDIYTSGEYLEATQTWHAEDSPWKAKQIIRIIRNNDIRPGNIAEIGCGVGMILEQLAKEADLKDVQFIGYDISPQAIELCKNIENDRINFYCQDFLAEYSAKKLDVLLVIDVFEHIPDYIRFVEGCRDKAEYKIYHIPLGLHVSSVLRNTLLGPRYSVGHLHYFTADTAIATLKDSGHEIVDYFYTHTALDLFKLHPSIKRAIANGPRWLFSKFSVPIAARLFGGYSLLVLAK